MTFRIISMEGMTVRQLRHLLGTMEEADADGNDAMVFLAVGNLHISVTVGSMVDADGDLILVSDHAQAVMEDLGTWDDFAA
jgi:hypothetical protein